jgi:hypothetical protein
MPSVKRPGRTGVYLDLPTDLVERFRAFVRGRGEPLTAHVARAMERHLRHPPPAPALTDPPLPDLPARKARKK